MIDGRFFRVITAICCIIQYKNSYSYVSFDAYKYSINNGEYVYVMVPGLYEDGHLVTNPSGKAYHIKDDGNLEFLWETNGWWWRNTEISSDGNYVVRVNHVFSSVWKKIDYGLIIYKNGKETYRYSLADLGVNVDGMDCDYEGYCWWVDFFELLDRNKMIIRTKSGIQTMYNIENGEVIYRLNKSGTTK